MELKNNNIIIFDGVCNFCNGAVNFILKRDKHKRFMFTPMQSNFAKTLTSEFQKDKVDIDTIILIKDNVVFVRSEAVLEIVKDPKWILVFVQSLL